MSERGNGRTSEMHFRDSMRTLGLSLREHPWAIASMALCFTAIVVALVGAVLYFNHVQHLERQAWIETAYETRIDRNNDLLAKVNTELSQIDLHEERGAELLKRMTDLVVECTKVVRRVGDEIEEELRGLRIAVLESLKRDGNAPSPQPEGRP